jgi:hypothetical protein
MSAKGIDSQKIPEIKGVHSPTEDIEKERQRSAVLSVKKRLEIHVQMLEIGITLTQKIDAIINQDRVDQIMASLIRNSNLSLHTNVLELFRRELSRFAIQAQGEATELWRPFAKQTVDMTESLRADFRASLELSEKEFNRSYPLVKIDLEGCKNTQNNLIAFMAQEGHMILACDQILSKI